MIIIKLFFKILIAGFIGELIVILILNIINIGVLKNYERLEVIIGITGLITTFFGAYFGAKIAGSESRKLFKQQIKMNDLQQNMEINLDVLEYIEDVNKNLNFINELIKNDDFLDPKNLKKLLKNCKEINDTLESLKNKNLNKASAVLYWDVQIFHEKFKDVYSKIQGIIDNDETRELFKNVKGNEIPMEYIGSWEYLTVGIDNYIYFIICHDRKEIEKKISVDLIMEENKTFFKAKKDEVKSFFRKINNSFNNIEYKNREELIKEYTKIYKD